MKGKGSDHKAKSNHAMHADLLQRAALMKGGLVALRKPVMAAVGLFTMKVNFEDINRNREKLFQRRVDLSGFLSGGKWFYVLIDAAPPSAPSWDNPFVVVLDNNLHNSLCESEASPLCGSMVQYAGWATLTGVLEYPTGYPHSVAALMSISRYEFETEGMEGKITKVLFEPEESIFLQGQTTPTNQQVQLVKQIVGGEENLLQIRKRYFDGNRHLIAKWITPQESADIVSRLRAVGNKNVEVKYAETIDYI